ncbi:MAG: PilZ domain-containing protein [Nitrospira sp.]|nr:PilZ domain-containing protein [Nitrospira sp.]
MRQTRETVRLEPHQSHRSFERRRLPRENVTFGLMYSGVSGEDVLIGDGTVVDLSESGLGLRGDIPVQVGMEVTLFLYLSDRDEPLSILESKVVWSAGLLFGVMFTDLTLPDVARLRSFLRTHSVVRA